MNYKLTHTQQDLLMKFCRENDVKPMALVKQLLNDALNNMESNNDQTNTVRDHQFISDDTK